MSAAPSTSPPWPLGWLSRTPPRPFRSSGCAAQREEEMACRDRLSPGKWPWPGPRPGTRAKGRSLTRGMSGQLASSVPSSPRRWRPACRAVTSGRPSQMGLTGQPGPHSRTDLPTPWRPAHAASTEHGFSPADLRPLPGRHLMPARRLSSFRQPGHCHARRPAASLTMTTTASSAPHTRHGEHCAATMSTNRRSCTPNAPFVHAHCGSRCHPHSGDLRNTPAGHQADG